MLSGKGRYYKFSSYGIKCLSIALAATMTLGMASCGRRGNVEDSKLRLSRKTTDSSSSRSERVIKRNSTTTTKKERKTVKTLASTVKPSVVKTNPASPQPTQEKKTNKPTQPPVTQAPATQPPATEPPVTQPPATEAPTPAPAPVEEPVTDPVVDNGDTDADVNQPGDSGNEDGDVIVVEPSEEEVPDTDIVEPSETEFILNDFVATSLADISTIEFGSAGSSLKMTSSLVNFVESWPEDINEIIADPAKLSEAANLAIANMDETTLKFLEQALPMFYEEGQKLLNDRNLLEISARDAGVELPEKLPTAQEFKQVIEAIALAANISLELPTEVPAENVEPEGDVNANPEAEGGENAEANPAGENTEVVNP